MTVPYLDSPKGDNNQLASSAVLYWSCSDILRPRRRPLTQPRLVYRRLIHTLAFLSRREAAFSTRPPFCPPACPQQLQLQLQPQASATAPNVHPPNPPKSTLDEAPPVVPVPHSRSLPFVTNVVGLASAVHRVRCLQLQSLPPCLVPLVSVSHCPLPCFAACLRLPLLLGFPLSRPGSSCQLSGHIQSSKRMRRQEARPLVERVLAIAPFARAANASSASQPICRPRRHPLRALQQTAPVPLRGHRVLPSAAMPPHSQRRQRVDGSRRVSA